MPLTTRCLARPLFVLALLAALPAPGEQEPHERGDRLMVIPQKSLNQLSWRDAEDVVEGAVLPARPQVGETITVSVRVGTLQGAPFDGPVSLTIRHANAKAGETKMVNADGERWMAEFTAQEPGAHTVSVGFRTTRHKVLHADFQVQPAPLPRSIAWGAGAALVLLAVGFGAFRLLRRKEPENPAPPAG